MAAKFGAKRRPVTFNDQQAVFTIAQAIAFGIPSRSAIYRLFTSGTLTPLKLGGSTVVSGDQLRSFMANLPAAPVRTQTPAVER